jgi:phosphoribosylanthranilate isomerase
MSFSHSTPQTPRIKICGITREEDRDAAIVAGADALGFVLYEKSPRCVSVQRLEALTKDLPPFITPVLLFVNATPEVVRAALEMVPNALLQFHGDESPAECVQFKRPFMRAARIHSGFDLLQYAQEYHAASALLLDTYTPAYGGSGETFEWSQLPKNVPSRLVLSGGLSAANVAAGIAAVKPWAVDVSSGVEATDSQGRHLKGIKDAAKIQAFCAAVRNADLS